MIILYSLSIGFLRIAYWVAAWVHPKARLFVSGRNKQFSRLQSDLLSNTQKVVWVHCASLGEFEQGRPVIEQLRQEFPTIKILLTFFSPSGYEVRKNYSGAEYIYYLPWDSARNARRFIELTQPVLTIFVKYEFWHYYTDVLKQKHIPILSISTILRNNQVFFKWYGSFFRTLLKRFDHFFVQNMASATLLKNIGISQVTLAGDTRFDRVHAITRQNKVIPTAEKFKGTDKVFVIGSLWPEDLDVIIPFIKKHKQSLKFILAPHELSEIFIQQIEKSVDAKSIRFSRESSKVEDATVLIIDNIGMLSALYRYGEFAYVGGAFGKGLHNILEAACYGMPVFFGNKNYKKFNEATELIMRGGAFAISGYSELEASYESMVNRPENFLLACEVTKAYVQENLGATEKIMNHCRNLLTT